MTHLDDAILVALRDREPVPESAHRHLDACEPCGAALTDVEVRAVRVAQLLDALGGQDIDMEAARTRTRERLDRSRAARSVRARPWWRPEHLGRAAAVLLLTAGAVSALPGSPFRAWLDREPGRTGPAADAVLTTTAPQEAETAGVAVPVPASGIRVLIRSLGPLGRLEVVWTDDPTARLSAPIGSRFTYGEGRVEATVAGGPVRIELPGSGSPISVEVDGRAYLTRSGNETRVTGPVGEQSESRILFTAP